VASEQDLRIIPGVVIPADQLQWRFSTAGGAGGQHVNTSNTRAEVVVDIEACEDLPAWAKDRILARLGPTVTAAAGDRRSQTRNRDLALERLKERLVAALHVERPRRPTRPTLASQRRRVDDKRRRGDLKRRRGSGGDPAGD